MSAQRQIQPDATATAESCARHALTLLEEALSNQELATLAVSGGSSPKLMFDVLAASQFRWDRVHLFWVDERCVPPTDPASNYRLTFEHLIQNAHIPQHNIHRIVGEMDPEKAAVHYADEIRGFFGLEAGEFPHFDLVHLGMGPDAHTASLFPGSPLIDDHDRIAGAVFAPQFNQWRVTLLPGALRAAKHTVFLVAGADKKESLRAVFKDPYNPKRFPAQLPSHDGRDVTWFLDRAAAELID
jgi:6-phosphogluconolactonase